MIIETKFDPGQEVWFMDYATSRPFSDSVDYLRVQVPPHHVEYFVGSCWREESELFPSKSELLASL